MNVKRLQPTLILLALLCTAAQATPPWLITPDEALASFNAPAALTTRSLPVKDAPVIEVMAPKLGGTVGSPTPIQLKFNPVPPSSVKPESFKVLYGAFQIDITKRLLNVAKVTEQGLQIPEAALPKGRHKLLMSVEDSAGRLGNRVVDFEVN
jgi:hypothetical protein